jgi:hypothetical protein
VVVSFSPYSEDCPGAWMEPSVVFLRVDTDPSFEGLVAYWPGGTDAPFPGWAVDSPYEGAVPIGPCDPPLFSHCTPACDLGVCDWPDPPSPPPDRGTGTSTGTGGSGTSVGTGTSGSDTGTTG